MLKCEFRKPILICPVYSNFQQGTLNKGLQFNSWICGLLRNRSEINWQLSEYQGDRAKGCSWHFSNDFPDRTLLLDLLKGGFSTYMVRFRGGEIAIHIVEKYIWWEGMKKKEQKFNWEERKTPIRKNKKPWPRPF